MNRSGVLTMTEFVYGDFAYLTFYYIDTLIHNNHHNIVTGAAQ